jgi:hypothetical protein
LPLALGAHDWLRRLILVVVLYLALLPVWWYSLDALTIVWAAAADLAYGVFDSQATIEAAGKTISFYVMSEGQQHSSALKVDTASYGIPLVIALVIATPGSLRSKLKALAVGLAVMLVIMVPAVMAWAKLTSLQLEEQLSPSAIDRGTRSQFLYYAFHGFAFSQPVLAVITWFGLLMLGMFKAKEKAKEEVITAGRNDPCPCGSGLKYKRCCGRLASAS